MLDSGRWGKEITEQLGKVTEIKGGKKGGREKVKIIAKNTLLKRLSSSKSSSSMTGLKSGDFYIFYKGC